MIRLLLEEPLLVLLTLIVAIDDLQEEAGQCDQLVVWSREEAFEKAVPGLVKQDKDGQGILHLKQSHQQEADEELSKHFELSCH